MDSFAGKQRERIGIARVNPHRRVRSLQRFNAQRDVLILAKFAGETESAIARKRTLDQCQSLVSDRAALGKVGAIRSEEIRHDSGNQANLEAAVGEIIQHRDFLGDTQGIVQGQDITHGADADALGPRRRSKSMATASSFRWD